MSTDQHLSETTLEQPAVVDSTVDAGGLDEDPFDDDLDAQLRARAPWMPSRATLFLGGAVLVVAGFIGGAVVQKTVNPAPTTGANAAAAPGGFTRNGQGGAGGQGTGSGQSSPTTGTVKLVDGTTIYLTTADGEVVTVKTTSTTTVRTQQTTAVKDIPVGATVSVLGTTGTDGTVTATQVTAQK